MAARLKTPLLLILLLLGLASGRRVAAQEALAYNCPDCYLCNITLESYEPRFLCSNQTDRYFSVRNLTSAQASYCTFYWEIYSVDPATGAETKMNLLSRSVAGNFRYMVQGYRFAPGVYSYRVRAYVPSQNCYTAWAGGALNGSGLTFTVESDCTYDPSDDDWMIGKRAASTGTSEPAYPHPASEALTVPAAAKMVTLRNSSGQTSQEAQPASLQPGTTAAAAVYNCGGCYLCGVTLDAYEPRNFCSNHVDRYFGIRNVPFGDPGTINSSYYTFYWEFYSFDPATGVETLLPRLSRTVTGGNGRLLVHGSQFPTGYYSYRVRGYVNAAGANCYTAWAGSYGQNTPMFVEANCDYNPLDDMPRGIPTKSISEAAYPNPASETLTLPTGATMVMLRNKEGSAVVVKIRGGQLDIAELPEGLYTLQMRANGKMVSQRIQVKH